MEHGHLLAVQQPQMIQQQYTQAYGMQPPVGVVLTQQRPVTMMPSGQVYMPAPYHRGRDQ